MPKRTDIKKIVIIGSGPIDPSCLSSRAKRGICTWGCEVERYYYVYIIASRSRNLYTGVTGNLTKRVYEHKEGLVSGFTKRYRICRLVWFDTFRDVRAAIAREKQIKSWTRAKRIALIESMNLTWGDLAEDWYSKGTKEMQVPRFARDDKATASRGIRKEGSHKEEMQKR